MKTTPAERAEIQETLRRINAEDLQAGRRAQLAACPFCAGECSLISRLAGPLVKGSYAGCQACDIFTPIQPSDEAAVARWNRRDLATP